MAEAAIGGAATQVGKESLAIVSFVGRSMTRPIRDVIKHIRDQETYEDAQEQLTLLVEAARVVSASDAAAMNDLLGTWMALVKSWRLTRKQDKRLKWVKEQLHGKMVAAGYGHWDEDTNEYEPRPKHCLQLLNGTELRAVCTGTCLQIQMAEGLNR